MDSEHCPICGEMYRTRARDFAVDSTCENGHKWHVCVVHQKIALGHTDPKEPAYICSCNLQNNKDKEEQLAGVF